VFPLHAIRQDDGLRNKKAAAEHVIELFLNHVRDVGKQGTLPLHHALVPVPDIDYIDNLIALDPDAVAKQDSQGSLPLCYALCNQPSCDLIEQLLNVYPLSIKAVDQEGSTPLHVACQYGASLEVVSC